MRCNKILYSCSCRRVSRKLWTVYETVSCIQQLRALAITRAIGFDASVKHWIMPRILDILILQDKTLFCACVDNFKQNGVFWRHCACVDNFKRNGVFWRQHLPAVRVRTWPKYNKHHHDFKKPTMPLYRYVHRENILADGTMSRMPRKRDLGTRLGRVRFVFDSDETGFTVVCAAFRCIFYRLG